MLNFAHPCRRKLDLIGSFRRSFSHGARKLPEVARTTESVFQAIKGHLRNAIFSDFNANWRTISKFEKNFLSKFTCHFSLLSIRYLIRIGSADFEFVI